MQDLTEQQEQEMIRRAKAGDPEANYQMSLWALEQAIAEPEEERWNRLAAKCLVKAVDAGYEPAKEKMRELLGETEESSAPQPEASSYEYDYAPRPRRETSPRDERPAGPETAPAASRTSLAGIGAAIGGFAAAAAAKVKGLFARSGKSGPSGTKTGRGGKGGFLNFSEWDDAKWKKMQRICVIVCIVLVLLIILLLITGKKRSKETQDVVPTPVAELVDTPAPSPTPQQAAYPNDTVRQEIAAASLDTYPEEADFVTEAQTVTVATSGSSLNMRRGPGQSANIVGSLPNGTTTDVYAFKNGWALVKYDGTWGWCSKEYLK